MSKLNIILFDLNIKKINNLHYNCIIKNYDKFNIKYIVDFDKNYLNKNSSNKKLINYFHQKNKLIKLLENNQIDAFIINSIQKNTYEIINLGLSYNQHIFIQSYISDNYDEIVNCFEFAQKKNKILFVGYYKRFDNILSKIKNSIDKINFVNSCFAINRYNYDETIFKNNIFHNFLIMDIDYINWILNDKPIQVYVMNDDNFNNIIINLKYSLGTICNIHFSKKSSSYDNRCEFYGHHGEIINNFFLSTNKISFFDKYKECYQNQLLQFYDYIINHKKCIIKKEDCLSNLIIADACQESSKKKKKITIKYYRNNSFRNYSNTTKAIKHNYKIGRIYQTLHFVLNVKKKYHNFNLKMNIWDIFDKLNHFIDISDPDISLPNTIHAFQSAEKAREDKKPDWFIITCLIHDLGKIMYLKGNDKEGTGKNYQWAIVGDTFPLGCKLSSKIVYSEFNDLNLDNYKTKLGIYKENCGLDNLIMSYGHDEYLYSILNSKKNPNKLPIEALYIIRYHSFYAYHTENDYFYFQNDKDISFFKYLKDFNQYDLYTKSEHILDINKLKPYYSSLIKKYFINDYLYL